MQLAIPKKLIVRVFAVNLGLVLVAIAGVILLAGSNPLREVLVLCLMSYVFLPFSAGMLVTILPKRRTLWTLGTLTIASLLAFGFWGIGFLCLVPLWSGLMIPAMGRTLSSVILGVFVMGVWLGMLLPKLDTAGPAALAKRDMGKIEQICLSVAKYREAHSTFPDRLSQLQDVADSLNLFISPRGAGMIQPLQNGPLRRRPADEPPDPGPWRKITSWSEVDGGDYLYRKPPNDAPTNTIMVMTRSGLLYRNRINVGFVDGHVETLEPKVWKNRADVIEFLKQTGAAPP